MSVKQAVLNSLFIGSLFFGVAVSAADSNYPLRKNYPNATPIEVAEAFKQYDKCFFVDVRSKFEYDVVHVSKAVHNPMNNKGLFLENLEAMRTKSDGDPIFLYCNGVNCKKSYDAANYATDAGFKKVYVLDAGVISWLKAHPDKSYLLGSTPANPSKVISDEKFKSHMVEFAAFKKASEDANAVFFDVRDATQQKNEVDLPNLKHMQLDNILPLLKKGTFKDKELFILDAVGKQVEWLQYYLEEYDYKNYHFLKGGTDAL